MHGTFPAKTGGKLVIMDPSGHTEIKWSASNEVETEIARAAFNSAIGRNYSAFRVTEAGGRGARVTSFDPEAERYILAPQLVGG